jgi:hypothetical protein
MDTCNRSGPVPVGLLIVLVAGLTVNACGAESRLPTSATSVSEPRCGDATWFADHETGDLSQWYLGGRGGELNNGGGLSTASTDVARSGRYSAKATISAPPTAGVRLTRFTKSVPEGRYSAWYYFPQIYRPSWWIIFQYKSRARDSVDPDPFWYLKVSNRPNGTMFLVLQWWPELWPDRGVEGPHRGEFGGKAYEQTIVDLPVHRWVHIEAYLRQSSDFTGRIMVWQDGLEIFNQNDVKTRYPFEGDDWAASSYSESISPSPATIYIDDASVSPSCAGSTPAGAASSAEP